MSFHMTNPTPPHDDTPHDDGGGGGGGGGSGGGGSSHGPGGKPTPVTPALPTLTTMGGVVLLLVGMIVMNAVSAKGMYQLGCKKNLSAFWFFVYSMLNSLTFGVYGLIKAHEFRDARFELVQT